MKNTQVMLTRGVSNMLDEDITFHPDLELILDAGSKYFDKSYFLSIKKSNKQVVVTDGNDNVFTKFISKHSGGDYRLYYIRDEYEDCYVATVLFPDEY